MQDVYQIGLPAGFGKNPGSAVVNVVNIDIGPGSHIDCTSSGIHGQTGPQSLLLLGFEVTGISGSGQVTMISV